MKLRAVVPGLVFMLTMWLAPLYFLLAQTTTPLQGLDQSAGAADLQQVNLDVPELIGKWLGIILGFTGTIFFILVVWAGLTWMTAAGNEENIKKAQSILKTAIIGLIVVLSAYAITRFIGTSLGT